MTPSAQKVEIAHTAELNGQPTPAAPAANLAPASSATASATPAASASSGALLLRDVRSRVEARRAFERLQVVSAILLVTFGLAPLVHELTAAATRPKPRSAASGVETPKGPTTSTPEPPLLLPVLVSLTVLVAGILFAGIVHRELKPWDDSSDRIALNLKRLLEQDGEDRAAWRLDMLLKDADQGDDHANLVRSALRRHDDSAYPAIAPVRFVFGGLLPLAALLAVVLLASGLAMRMNLTAVPAAEWSSHARAAVTQGQQVLAGPISPLTLLSATSISITGIVAMVIGWLLGRSTLLVPAEQPAGANPTQVQDGVSDSDGGVPHWLSAILTFLFVTLLWNQLRLAWKYRGEVGTRLLKGLRFIFVTCIGGLLYFIWRRVKAQYDKWYPPTPTPPRIRR